MVGGKVKPDETSWQGALRELKEETGFVPTTFWTIPSVNSFYEHKSDTVHHIPAFAAEIKADQKPILDDEHTEYEWLPLEEAVHRISWPEQQRLLKLTESIITENEILEDWIVSTT
jgi:dATP pyrophosphohydrolase